MEHVTIVNRSSKILRGTWDGRVYELKPGKHSFPLTIAEAFKRQNPVMGSEDPITGHIDYLVGIEEHGDPTDPMEQSQAIERLNRARLKGARPTEVVAGDNGIYSVRDVKSDIGTNDTGFVKP